MSEYLYNSTSECVFVFMFVCLLQVHFLFLFFAHFDAHFNIHKEICKLFSSSVFCVLLPLMLYCPSILFHSCVCVCMCVSVASVTKWYTNWCALNVYFGNHLAFRTLVLQLKIQLFRSCRCFHLCRHHFY